MVRGMGIDLDDGDRAEAGRLLALGSVVPGVVHELNNALLGLLGMIELPQADATGPAALRGLRGMIELAQAAATARVSDSRGTALQAWEDLRKFPRVLGALAREPL